LLLLLLLRLLDKKRTRLQEQLFMHNFCAEPQWHASERESKTRKVGHKELLLELCSFGAPAA
jgi:hypothetical protein